MFLRRLVLQNLKLEALYTYNNKNYLFETFHLLANFTKDIHSVIGSITVGKQPFSCYVKVENSTKIIFHPTRASNSNDIYQLHVQDMP